MPLVTMKIDEDFQLHQGAYRRTSGWSRTSARVNRSVDLDAGRAATPARTTARRSGRARPTSRSTSTWRVSDARSRRRARHRRGSSPGSTRLSRGRGDDLDRALRHSVEGLATRRRTCSRRSTATASRSDADQRGPQGRRRAGRQARGDSASRGADSPRVLQRHRPRARAELAAPRRRRSGPASPRRAPCSSETRRVASRTCSGSSTRPCRRSSSSCPTARELAAGDRRAAADARQARALLEDVPGADQGDRSR